MVNAQCPAEIADEQCKSKDIIWTHKKCTDRQKDDHTDSHADIHFLQYSVNRFIRYAMPMLIKIVTTIVNPICVMRYSIFKTWLLSLLFIKTLPIQSDIHKAYYIRFFLIFQSFIHRIKQYFRIVFFAKRLSFPND